MKQLDEIASMKNAYIAEFYFSFDFLEGIEDKVRSVFTFKNPLDERNQAIAEQMSQETSVSLHIRRGDYIGTNHTQQSTSYFSHAMNYFMEKFKDVHFYVFSDDIPWCRENIKADKITFIDWNTGDDSWKDMQLMSLCKHNIITNSSFSAWGAWLNANPDKIVIRPKKYYDSGVEHPFPDGWIVMDN